MNIVVRIARRFVFDRSHDPDFTGLGFVSFIAAISIVGLALGVSALLVVTSVMNGFERELKSALTAFHGHIILFSRNEPMTHPEKYETQILKEFPDVIGISPYFFTEAMLSSSYGVAGSMLEGINPSTLRQVSRIEEKIIEGRFPQAITDGSFPEITLGFEIARKLHVKTGDSIILTIPFENKRGDEAPLVKKLHVSGVMRLGMYDYDNKYALMEITDLQKILSMEGKVNAFKLKTRDPSRSLQITNELNNKYIYPIRARDWSSLNRNLFYAIRLEKIVISIIMMAIVLVASFNIISTIMMMVHDKKRQISMLKALGLGRAQTFSIFLLISVGLSLTGTLFGLVLSRSLCAIVSWKSIIDLPNDIYMLSRLPIEIRPWEWGVICLVTVALALGSTLWPSFRMSQESPVEGLRYE